VLHQAVLAAARKLQKLSEAAGGAADIDTTMQRAAAAAGLDWEPTNSSSNSTSSSSSSSGSAQAIAAARTKLAVLLLLGMISLGDTDTTSSTVADNTDLHDVSSTSASSSRDAAVSRKDMQQRMELLGMVATAATAVAGGASEDRVAAETCWLDGARYTSLYMLAVFWQSAVCTLNSYASAVHAHICTRREACNKFSASVTDSSSRAAHASSVLCNSVHC
jgi:hypothetical protein